MYSMKGFMYPGSPIYGIMPTGPPYANADN